MGDGEWGMARTPHTHRGPRTPDRGPRTADPAKFSLLRPNPFVK